jgi:hypothetical protein
VYLNESVTSIRSSLIRGSHARKLTASCLLDKVLEYDALAGYRSALVGSERSSRVHSRKKNNHILLAASAVHLHFHNVLTGVPSH